MVKDAVLTTHGEELKLDSHWENEDGMPSDLAGATITVVSASREAIKHATFDTVGPGHARMTLQREHASAFEIGNNNWFRVQVLFPDGSNIVTPKIRVVVE